MTTVLDLIKHYYSPAWQARTVKKLAKFGVSADEVLTESLVLFLGNLITKLQKEITSHGSRDLTHFCENANFVLKPSGASSEGNVGTFSREHQQETQESDKVVQPIQASTDRGTGRNCDESSQPSGLLNKAPKQQLSGVLSDPESGIRQALELLRGADEFIKGTIRDRTQTVRDCNERVQGTVRECREIVRDCNERVQGTVRECREIIRNNTALLGAATDAVGSMRDETKRRLAELTNGEYPVQGTVHSTVRGAGILDFHGKVHTGEDGVTTVKTSAVEVID